MSCEDPLWIVAQVQGTGHQLYQLRDHAVTYWVSRWEPPAMGGDPPSLPPSEDLEIFVHVPIARAGKLQNKYISIIYMYKLHLECSRGTFSDTSR